MLKVSATIHYVYSIIVFCSSEISAKYTETSAKTGYNIGEGSWVYLSP